MITIHDVKECFTPEKYDDFNMIVNNYVFMIVVTIFTATARERSDLIQACQLCYNGI